MKKTITFDSDKQYEDFCFLLNLGAEQFTRSLLLRERSGISLREIVAIQKKIKQKRAA